MSLVFAPVFLFVASLQVISAAEWSVKEGPLPVVVLREGDGSQQLSVAGSFVESTDRYALPGGAVVLCDAAAGACNPSVLSSPETVQTLYLRYEGEARPGTYTGKLIIHSGGEKSEEKNLTIYVSSREHRGWGIAAVLFGGFIAWWVRVYASNRVTRDQALLPIALYYERLRALDAALKKAEAQVGLPLLNLSRAVARWVARLDVNSLEAEFNLPHRSPSPFTSTPTVSSNFTGFLTEAGAAITLLDIFVGEGVEQVLGLAAAGRIPSPKVPEVVNSIDALYEPQLQPEDARGRIRDEIAKARAASPEAAFLPSEDAIRTPAPPPSLNRLLVEIRRLNLTAWCVLLVVTALGTIITVVLTPGFGRPTEYLLCLTASFGIPMLGSIVIPSQRAAAAVMTSSHAVSGSKGSAVV